MPFRYLSCLAAVWQWAQEELSKLRLTPDLVRETEKERERERAHEVPGNYTCHQDRLHIRLYIEASTEESVVGSIPFAE